MTPSSTLADFLHQARTLRLISGIGLLVFAFCLGTVVASGVFFSEIFVAYFLSLVWILGAGLVFFGAIHLRTQRILEHPPRGGEAPLPELIPLWMTVSFTIAMVFSLAWLR